MTGIPEHAAIARIADEWQSEWWWSDEWAAMGEMSADLPARRREIAHLIGGAGEELRLALAAQVEVVTWREEPGHDEDFIEAGQRAMAEIQAYYALSAGHDLANVVARVIALRREGRSGLNITRRQGMRTDFTPFSREQRDWLSLNKETRKELRMAAKALGIPEIDVLVEPSIRLAKTRTWQGLVDARAIGFHKWRAVSIALVDARRYGEELLGSHQPGAEQLAVLAHRGTIAVARAMDRTYRLLAAACRIMGAPFLSSRTATRNGWL